jgi:hypothetical protein
MDLRFTIYDLRLGVLRKILFVFLLRILADFLNPLQSAKIRVKKWLKIFLNTPNLRFTIYDSLKS